MADPATVANIGPRERRRRRVMGAWTLALATVLAVLSTALGWGAAVRLLLAPLFFGGFLGVLQAREHTCVALASKGLCDLDVGPRPIDPSQDRAVRSKARRVLMKSAVAALVATLVVVLVLP